MKNLSLADVFAESIYTQWDTRDPETDGIEWEPVIPYPTEAAIDEYWPEWRESSDVACFADETGQTELGAAIDLFEAWPNDARRDEWEDLFWPQMNFRYPVTLGYDVDEREVAARIKEAAGCVTLMRSEDWRGETVYALALTGGGMDLTWNICAAYVAAGNVPPVHFLRNLPTMAGNSYGATVDAETASAVLRGAQEAAEHLAHVADRIATDAAARLASRGYVYAAPRPVTPEGGAA